MHDGSSWLQGVPTNAQLTFAEIKAFPELCARLQVIQAAKDVADVEAIADAAPTPAASGKRQKLANLIRQSSAWARSARIAGPAELSAQWS
jgi:hypothetical protein